MRKFQATISLGPAQRMTLDDAVQDRRQRVESRRCNGIAAAFQTSGQRTGHSAFAPCAWNCKRNLLIIEPLDEPLWDLDRATGSPRFPCQTDNHRPGSDKVMDSTCDLDRMKPTFGGCIEMVGGAKSLADRRGFSACQLDGGFVAQRKSQRVFSGRLGHYRDRNRSTETVVEITDETISDTDQLVRSRTSNSDLDTSLKSAPERPEILSHDR